jgi:hypothetical protein
MSRQDETYSKDRYFGSGRADQFETAGDHSWQVDARKDNSNPQGLAPKGVVILRRRSVPLRWRSASKNPWQPADASPLHPFPAGRLPEARLD